MLAPPRVGQRVAGCKPTASCLFQILDRRSSAGVSSHGTILRDKESWHSLGKKRCGFKLRKLQAEIMGNSWQDKCKSLGQVMVYGSSLSPWEASLRNAAGPFFSSSSNRFWPHASWSFPVAFPMAATPESLCPWRAKYSQKKLNLNKRDSTFWPCSHRKQTNRWRTPKISFLFNFQPGKSCFNCFSTMLPRANAAWPVLETCHRLPNVAGRYRRPPNTRYKDQTTWAKHSQKAPHSPGDCENEIIKAVGEWKILKWKS